MEKANEFLQQYDMKNYASNIINAFKMPISLEREFSLSDEHSASQQGKAFLSSNNVNKIDFVTINEEDDSSSTKKSIPSKIDPKSDQNRKLFSDFNEKKRNSVHSHSIDHQDVEYSGTGVLINPYASTKRTHDSDEFPQNSQNLDTTTIVTPSSSSTSRSSSITSPSETEAQAQRKAWKDVSQSTSTAHTLKKNDFATTTSTKRTKSSNYNNKAKEYNSSVTTIDKKDPDGEEEEINSSTDELKTVGSINGVLLDISHHPGTEPNLKKKPYFEAADEIYNESMKTNLNRVSFVGKTLLSSDHARQRLAETSHLVTTPIEISMNTDLYCKDCKQLSDFCHRKVYSDYIKKKVFYEYANITVQPECDAVLKKCKDCYNEIRRVCYHQKFNFYDGAEQELPPCLYAFSWEIVHMTQEIIEGAKINNETKDGIVQLIAAKRLRRAS